MEVDRFWCSASLNPLNSISAPSGRTSRAIWRYVEAIQAEGETNYLKSRFADIRLYLEYVKEFNLQSKAGHPGQTAKIRATNAICGTASLPKARADKTRMSFHSTNLLGSGGGGLDATWAMDSFSCAVKKQGRKCEFL